MSSACVTTPHCGYCGRPIVGASVWSLCAVYHPECTRGPSFDTGLGYEFPPAPDHRDAEIARLRAELAEAEGQIAWWEGEYDKNTVRRGRDAREIGLLKEKLVEAEARGYRRGIEDAAAVAEAEGNWHGRAIAERIRALGKKE